MTSRPRILNILFLVAVLNSVSGQTVPPAQHIDRLVPPTRDPRLRVMWRPKNYPTAQTRPLMSMVISLLGPPTTLLPKILIKAAHSPER